MRGPTAKVRGGSAKECSKTFWVPSTSITQNVLEVKSLERILRYVETELGTSYEGYSSLTTRNVSATICQSPRSLPPSTASPAYRRQCSCEVKDLSQETIARILSVERDATGIYDEAQRQAALLIEEAKEAASALREQTLAQARQEAEQTVARGREAAEAERARILAQAEAEAQRMATLAARHLDRAVSFVLDQVTGRE